MKKNKRPPVTEVKATSPRTPLLTKKCLQFIGAGVVTLVIGYTVLSFADSKAQNLPGLLSPFLILAGYGLIGAGLFVNSKPTEKI